MTGTDPSLEDLPAPKCLFIEYAENDEIRAECSEEPLFGKIFCKKHIGKKQHQEAKS